MSKRRYKQKPKAINQRRIAIFTIISGIVLLLVVGVLALGGAKQSAAPATVSEIPDYHDDQGIPYPEVKRIPVAEARAMYDAGTALFVDVRSQGEYDTAHVANALSLPLADLDARYQELPKDTQIITYCT